MDMWGTAGCPIQTDTYRFAFVVSLLWVKMCALSPRDTWRGPRTPTTRGSGQGSADLIYIHHHPPSSTNDWFIGGFCLIFHDIPAYLESLESLDGGSQFTLVFGVEVSQRGLS